MKILALDASSDHCSVAVLNNGKVFFDVSETPRSHAQNMLPMVDTLLTSASLGLNDIDLIALTHGPGSFTGIRIAVSVAQGLSYASSIPCLPISSMSAMTYNYADLLRADTGPIGVNTSEESERRQDHLQDHPQEKALKKGDLIFAALDARMQEIYWSVFEVAEEGLIELQAPTLSPEANFLARVFSSLDSTQWGPNAAQESNSDIHCIGNGWSVPVVKQDIEEASLRVCCDCQPSALGILSMLKSRTAYNISDSYDSPSDQPLIDDETAINVVDKDLERLSSVLLSADKLEPLYLRNEVSWKKRTRIRSDVSPIVE